MDVGRRLKLGLLALVAMIGAAMALTTVAQARTIPDPELSNIPYLAWRGQEVRIAKCSPELGFNEFRDQGYNVDFNLVDWSGDPHLAGPVMEAGTLITARRHFDGAACFGVDFVSQKAGIAVIKMTVSTHGGIKILTHDFLVIWMNLNSIVLCNNSSPGLCSGPTTVGIGDYAGGPPNVLEANITGNVPLLQDFNELGIGHDITLPDGSTVLGLVMPDDWATLANKMATQQGPLSDPASFWDIHDNMSDTEGHSAESPNPTCLPRLDPANQTDAVDQCTDPGSDVDNGLQLANENQPFSSIWSTLIGPPSGGGPVYGPFDPARPSSTYLSNGTLDQFDAPMPPARIDFTIAPNSGGPTDISGVGTFEKVDKGLCPGDSRLNDANGEPTAPYGCVDSLYVRPGNTTPHHLYAPFYRMYLPATNAHADPFSSGIDDFLANNFNGYLNLGGNALADPSGKYDFWDIAEWLRWATAAPTNCLDHYVLGFPVYQMTPGDGPQSVAVYSDEHGEARAAFLPGTGFWFDNFGIKNANQGCDLAGIQPLGTAAITATARYPFEPVTAQPLVSNTVAKSVASNFVKLIQCYPKGPSAFDQQTAVCVAHAQNIALKAITGERVCFFSNGEGTFLPALSQITIPDQTLWPTIHINPAPSLNGFNNVCAYTDFNGNTAVEVVETDNVTDNVTAFFVDEGLMRSVHVTFPITGPTAAVTGPVAAQKPNNQSTNTQVPLNTGSAGNQSVSSSHVDSTVKIMYRITFARLVKHHKFLKLRLTGPKGKGSVAITYLTKKGKLKTLVRKVKANKKVKLRLHIPKKVRRLRLSVMPG